MSPMSAEATIRPWRTLFLIGARGSGKTTVGRLVAAKLGLPFIDADAVLEQKTGRPIREIFAAEGEAWFREREEEVLAEIAGGEPAVIATGGGAVLRSSNRGLMRRGRVVWLRADAQTLWQRTSGDPTTLERRPDLAGGGLGEVVEILRNREPLYRECAHHEVSTAGRSPDAVACDIVAQCRISS
jgi:shikimate kinase